MPSVIESWAAFGSSLSLPAQRWGMQAKDGGLHGQLHPLHPTLLLSFNPGSCQAPGSLSKMQESWRKLQPKFQVFWAEDPQMNSLTSLSAAQTSSMSSRRPPNGNQKAGTLILKGAALLLSDPVSVTQLLRASRVQLWNRCTVTFSAFRVTARTKQHLRKPGGPGARVPGSNTTSTNS